MKTILTKVMALCGIMLLMLSACKKNDTLATVGSGKGGKLSSNVSTIVLDKTKANSTDSIITLSFTQADFGYKALVTDIIQIDTAGDNWANPDTILLNKGVLVKKFTSDDFNALLLKMHLTPDKATNVNIRIKSSIALTVAPVFSNILSLTVTPYSNAAYIYVPGAYQGWSPPTADSLTSAKGDGVYLGIVNYTPGNLDFKITPKRVWDNSYGSTDNKTLIYNGGGNITAPAAGGLLLTVNLNSNTITFTPQWSIIGDASPGGWGADTDMLFNSATNTWYLTVTLKSDGNQAIKFRYANDWAINLGGSGGTLTQNGGNINIPATAVAGDVYKITLNPAANTYTLVKQ